MQYMYISIILNEMAKYNLHKMLCFSYLLYK